MARFRIPYSRRFLDLELPDDQIAGVIESAAHHYTPKGDEQTLVRQALENPIQSERVSEMAKGKDKIVIITSDHTRPVPSRITLPILLKEIRSGNPDADITILIATGFHRLTTEAEMLDKFGEDIVRNERLINHDSRDESQLALCGTLPSGGELWLNKLAVEADLLVAEGFIEPHFFAGFSGGRKSVLPGVASATTVLGNHCASFIIHPNSRTGILDGNPIHKDMLYAAKQAKLAFILNVVIDADKKIIHAVAGDSVEAHVQGCEFVEKLASCEPVPADIVITSNGGYPLDQNIYQTVKGMTAGEATAKEKGVIIICSACNDGHGGEAFYQTFLNEPSTQAVMDGIMKTEMDCTVPDQWESQILARILLQFHVILMTDECDPKMVTDMHMIHASTIDEAIAKARELKGQDAKITVIPDGVSVIVKESAAAAV